MKKYWLLFTLLFSSLIFPQTVTINETQTKYTVRHYYGISPDFSYYQFDSAHDLGNYNVAQNKWMDWVSCYKISLGGVPSGYTIKSIKLTAYITQQEYTPNNFNAYISKLPNNTDLSTGSSNAEPLYNAISNSGSIGSFKYSDTLSQDIKSSITSGDFSDNYIIIGVQDAGSLDNSMAKISISLAITYYLPIGITIDNNFVDNSGNGTHGQVSIDGTTQTIPSSGVSLTRNVGQNLTLSAISPQQDNQAYQRTWHTGAISTSDWRRNNIFRSSNQTYPFSVAEDDSGKTYTANLRKVYNVTFQNSLPDGGGNTGYVWVDGTKYSVTEVTPKVEQNSITFSSDNNQPVVNGIASVFDHWSDGNTSSSRTITVSAHTGFTAIYKGKPLTSSRNLRFNDVAYGSYVTLTWSAHPSSNVTQCKIYQKVRVNGVMGAESLIATVSSATTTYIDYGYTVSSNTTTQLFYDVRYVYTGTLPDNTQYTIESDPNFQNIYGQIAPSYNDSQKETATTAQELPSDYSIGNYPNPFNPTTTINYQLPENGFVTIKVYDVLGKEVATLVNENKSAGYYNVSFDASKLTSGVYIYTINVNGFAQSKKMLLMK